MLVEKHRAQDPDAGRLNVIDGILERRHTRESLDTLV